MDIQNCLRPEFLYEFERYEIHLPARSHFPPVWQRHDDQKVCTQHIEYECEQYEGSEETHRPVFEILDYNVWQREYKRQYREYQNGKFDCSNISHDLIS